MHFSTLFTIVVLITPSITAAPTTPPSTVRVELRGPSELARQAEIRLNQLTPVIRDQYTDAVISDLEGNEGVRCQAYGDTSGTVELGERFGIEHFLAGGPPFEDDGEPVYVESVECFSFDKSSGDS
jgi:hypothetical protein